MATSSVVKLVFRSIEKHEKEAQKVLSGILFTDQNDVNDLLNEEGYLDHALKSLLNTHDLEVRKNIIWGLSNYVCCQ